MTEVFADAHYWIALVSPRDQWAAGAQAVAREVGGSQILTPEDVLVEVLAYFSAAGSPARGAAAALVRTLEADPLVEVIHQSHDSFLRGLDLYERRADKGYSLVDCISMVVMRDRAITDVLSGDQHLRQEGLVPLIGPGAP